MSLLKGQNKYFLNCFKCEASELLLFFLILFTIYLLAYHVSDCLLVLPICTQGNRAAYPLLSASATHLYTGQQSHLLSLLYMVTRQWKAYSEKKSRQSRASPVPLHMSICSQLSPPCYVSQNTSRNDFTSHK